MIAAGRLVRCMVAVVTFGALAIACTPSIEPAAAPTAPSRPAPSRPAPSPSPSPPEPPALPPPDPALMVDGLERVAEAVIRVEASGDGYDPGTGESYDRWSGSGFIVHDDGTAVTNAHVVAGAESLMAHVNGTSKAVRAKVVGVAPCIDVAIIRLAGAGYAWLPWSERPHQRQPVWLLGHPDGRIDVARAEGDVYDFRLGVASPTTAMQHEIWSSAPSRPGNSGSPLVDRDGRVVGVAHAFEHEDLPDTVAASASEVEPAVMRIRQGHHPADIGLGGYAAVHERHPVAGVRVSDVVPGSPAKRSGLRPGDMVIHVDDVRVARDGALDAFCQVLRDHAGPEPVRVRVVRGAKGRVFEALLGQERLRPVGRLDALDTDLLPVVDGHDHQPYDYTSVADASGRLRVDLPSAWADVDGRRFSGTAPALRASVDLGQYLDTWASPGITVLASRDANALLLDGLLEALDHEAVTALCVYDGRYALSDARYEGKLDLYSACTDAGLTVVAARLRPREVRGAVAVVMLLRTPRDLEALDRALDSLTFTP